MKIKRREFLKHSAVGLGGVLAGVGYGTAQEAKPGSYDPFETVTLGKTKLKVSRFCLAPGFTGATANRMRPGWEKTNSRS